MEGASAPLHGWRFLNRHPSLWRYAILPIVFNLLITVLALAVLIAGAVWFITELHPRLTEGVMGEWWWAAVAMEIIAGILMLLVCAILTVLTWKHTIGLGAAVFLFEFIPVVGAVFLTTAAVGGVLLQRRIQPSAEGESCSEAVSSLGSNPKR